MDFNNIIRGSEYDFLRKNKHLGKNISMLCVSGSYGYGTNVETSDIDLRGLALPEKQDILLNKDFGQVSNSVTDTVIYSFNKIIHLLRGCNPNVIELLGLKIENYIKLDVIAKRVLQNRGIFLSKIAVSTFGGYANQQLRRIINKSSKQVTQNDTENFILQTIRHTENEYRNKYGDAAVDALRLYIDKAMTDGLDSEIYLDFAVKHIPLRAFNSFISDMNNVIRMYNKTGGRNENAMKHDKLGKHMMHLVRLYYTCFDILEKGEIIACRPEREELLRIRNGAYLNANNEPIPEFMEFVNRLEKRLQYDKENTCLPDRPNDSQIEDFKYWVYDSIVRD